MTSEITTPDRDTRVGHGVILLILNVTVVFFVLKNAKRAFLVNVGRAHTAFVTTPAPSRVNSSDRYSRGQFRSARTSWR